MTVLVFIGLEFFGVVVLVTRRILGNGRGFGVGEAVLADVRVRVCLLPPILDDRADGYVSLVGFFCGFLVGRVGEFDCLCHVWGYTGIALSSNVWVPMGNYKWFALLLSGRR